MGQSGDTVQTLLDIWLPDPDFSAVHQRTIMASPARTFAAIGRADFSRPWIVRSLMAVRSIPALFKRPSGKSAGSRSPSSPGSRRLFGIPFTLLADQAPTEQVLGIQGQFWRMDGGLERMTPDDFRAAVPPGRARAIWNFRLEPLGPATRLTTETRIRCGDPPARRQFGRYWTLIGPCSGILRRAILAEIAREAEGVGR